MSNARTYGTIHSEQKPFVIQHADSTDYLLGGSLVMKNGKIDKVLFDGGYAQATAVLRSTITIRTTLATIVRWWMQRGL